MEYATKKHGKSHHGYKFTVSVDRKHKFIRTWVPDTACVHDSQHLEAALDEWNTSAEIYADKGYVGADREERLREQGYRPQIQRKAKPGKALSTKKHGKSHHGYKFTVSVDRKHKFIRTWVPDTACVHDSQHLEAALDEWNTSAEIYADKGYVGADREERLREQGYRPQIQRKAKPGKALSACQERRNRRIAKVRARVEHVFAAIDTACVHDSQHLEAALDEWNTSAEIYADKGYVGADREERLREQGYRPQIQRKAKPGKALSACQERRNRRIAKVRARVEHVFAAIHQWGGKQIRTIGQARANFAMGMMVLVYNMRRLAFLGA
ncbi:transposase (plasmid) [Acidithiobacillus caldus]|nr:transposase [Acidithiobacillus caldus]